jgi:hypothetical protein
MICEHTDCPDGPCEGEVSKRSAMTAYHFEGVRNSKEDPNKDFIACDFHYACYTEHWTEMWNEYYSALGIYYER